MRRAEFKQYFMTHKFKFGLSAWALILSVAIFWGFHDLRSQTTQIQRDRLESCQRTYEGVREIFRPFAVDPKKATPLQRRNEAKFNRTIDKLIAHCGQQTGVSARANP